MEGIEAMTAIGGKTGRTVGRLGVLALALAVAGGAPGSAQAQSSSILRAQSQSISNAINRQIQQVMRPRLQVRNGAGPISALELGADNRSLAVVSADGGVRVWDLESGRQTRRLAAGPVRALDVGALPPGPSRSRSAAAEGQRVVAIGGDNGIVTLWDAIGGGQLRQFRGHQGPVQAVRLAPGGALLATGGADGTVRLWDVASGRQLAQLAGHAGPVASLAFSASGRLLASGGQDQTVRLWAMPDGRAVAGFSGQGAAVTALGFAGEDRLFSGGADGGVRGWSADSPAPVASWRAESGPVSALAVARGGSVLTAGGGGAHVWSAGGSQQAQINDPGNRIAVATFAPGGNRVITAGSSGLARVWDAGSGQPQAQLILTANGWAVVDTTGRFDGSESGLGNVSWAADQGVFDIANFSETYYEPGLLAKTLRAPGALLTPSATPVESGVGVPPTVTLSASSGPQAPAPGPVTITVVAQDQGAGVAQVWLFQNDKAVDPARITSDTTANQGGRQVRTVQYQVELAGGNNQFRAAAASVQRLEGLPATLAVRVAQPERKPVLHVVVVGVNQYANAQLTLNYAIADARGFVDWARRQANPDFARVEVHELLDRAATKPAILGLLRSLQSTQPEDVVVIYLAGHGENAKQSWHFLPTEFGRTISLEAVAAEGVASREFLDAVTRMGAQRVFMLIDACKSGSLKQAFMADADRKDLQSFSRNGGIHMLAATDKDQLAVELEDLGHGAFTYTVLDGLAGKADTQPADGVVRAKEILGYSSDTVPVVAFKYTQMEQVPTVFSRGSDFEIGRSRR
jgi:WD40 repeat protein